MTKKWSFVGEIDVWLAKTCPFSLSENSEIDWSKIFMKFDSKL